MMGQPPDTWEYIETNESFVNLRVCPIGLTRRPANPATIAAVTSRRSAPRGRVRYELVMMVSVKQFSYARWRARRGLV